MSYFFASGLWQEAMVIGILKRCKLSLSQRSIHQTTDDSSTFSPQNVGIWEPVPNAFPDFFFFFEKPTASFGLYILLSLFFSCSITLGISITRNYLYSLDYFGLKIIHTITTLHTWLYTRGFPLFIVVIKG